MPLLGTRAAGAAKGFGITSGQPKPYAASYLVVAGGGGGSGGSSFMLGGGGGGAGGYRNSYASETSGGGGALKAEELRHIISLELTPLKEQISKLHHKIWLLEILAGIGLLFGGFGIWMFVLAKRTATTSGEV